MANPLTGMVRDLPHPQTAFDLFAGEWAYDVPVAEVRTGTGVAFRHKHYAVHLAQQAFGSLAGLSCLELGPNEGEVSFHLHHAGCRPVTAIEGRVRSFLKCLVVKNFLHLDSVRFLLGDFVQHLDRTAEHYDLCVAAGMLYHMTEPLRVIELIARRADRLAVATHYFNEAMLRYDPAADTSGLGAAVWDIVDPAGEPHTYGGLTVRAYRYIYPGSAEFNESFAHGGQRPFALLLTRDDILRAVTHFGMKVVGPIHDDPAGPRGAHLFFVAERAGGHPSRNDSHAAA